VTDAPVGTAAMMLAAALEPVSCEALRSALLMERLADDIDAYLAEHGNRQRSAAWGVATPNPLLFYVRDHAKAWAAAERRYARSHRPGRARPRRARAVRVRR